MLTEGSSSNSLTWKGVSMAGTKIGGHKAALTNRKKYGKNFYALIGQAGGKKSGGGGFAANPKLASLAGRKGGKISRRGKAQALKD